MLLHPMKTVSKEFQNVQLPAIAVDILLFTIKNDDLQIGLIKREEEPHKNSFAMPGRFVRYDEKIEDTARIALEKKCGVNPESVYLEQLYTFGQNLDRDTRIRTISVVYYGLVLSEKLTSKNKFIWHSCYELPKMAFDHNKIVEYAIQRLRNKIKWEDYAFKFLPDEFTLTELQKVHEIILDQKIDKRNFRKKIFELDILKSTGRKKQEGIHRPALLYKVK